MNRQLGRCLVGGLAAAIANIAAAGTDTFFNPLTQSAAVAPPNHLAELNHPWVMPPGLSQDHLTGLTEAEESINGQTMLRVPGAGSSASMIDMTAYASDGNYLFLPHETPFGAGVSRYNVEQDFVETIFSGDLGGATGNWANDYGAFDPSTWTPNGTLFLAEEWAGEGRIIEILNPLAPANQIQHRELDSIANVAHEGLRFSDDGRTLYFVDEWNSGAFYKFVTSTPGDYTSGQTFVLVVDAYNGNPADNWNEASNAAQPRTGPATWVPLTDVSGNPLTQVDPHRNGPTNDPRSNNDTRGGRPAADEVGATPFGRPEDMEIGRLANGNEVVYVAVTSEQSVYTIEEQNGNAGTKAIVRVAASEQDTPKNLGFAQTTGVLNSPDNLAQDALGNIYIIEDAPNGSPTGGDIWFLRDINSDGIAESLDHFMSIQVAGSEATGMIFNPAKPAEFVVSVQHPASTSLGQVPNGFGDALWRFDLSDVVPPPCEREPRYYRGNANCSNTGDFQFLNLLERANRGAGR